MHKQKQDLEQAERLADCEFLALSWGDTLSKRVKGREVEIFATVSFDQMNKGEVPCFYVLSNNTVKEK
jgi:hypothetical protein